MFSNAVTKNRNTADKNSSFRNSGTSERGLSKDRFVSHATEEQLLGGVEGLHGDAVTSWVNFEGEENVKGTIMLCTGGFVFVGDFFRESQPEIRFLFVSRCAAVFHVDRLVQAVRVIGNPSEFKTGSS